jgi:hypothetical protein
MLVAIGLVYALTAVCAVHLGKNRRWQSPSSSLGPVVDLGYAVSNSDQIVCLSHPRTGYCIALT